MGAASKTLYTLAGLGLLGAGGYGGIKLGKRWMNNNTDAGLRDRIRSTPDNFRPIRIKNLAHPFAGGVRVKNILKDMATGEMIDDAGQRELRQQLPYLYGKPGDRNTWFLKQFEGTNGKELYQHPDDYWNLLPWNKLDQDARVRFQHAGDSIIKYGRILHQIDKMGFHPDKLTAMKKEFDTKQATLHDLGKAMTPYMTDPSHQNYNPQPVDFYQHLTDTFNNAAETEYGAGNFLPMRPDMWTQADFNPIGLPDWNVLNQAAQGGEIPRYDAGGELDEEDAQPFDWAGALRRKQSYEMDDVPSYAFGGYAQQAQQQMMAQQQQAMAQQQYSQALQMELAGHPEQMDYRSRMMMQSYMGQGHEPTSNFSQNGINDPTGELDWNWDPQQQAKQQQLDQAVRANIPYYQQAFNRMTQKSQNPKGSMRRIMPPQMR